MKINELIAEPQIDEGVGDILGKTAGHVVGATKAAGRGLKGMWKDAKAGYAAGKGAWDPKDAGTDSAPTGGAPAATGGASSSAPASTSTPAAPATASSSAPASTSTPAAPATSSGDIGSILQTIDKLDQPAKQQLASELEKNIAATPKPEAPTTPAAPAAPATPTTPAVPSGAQSLDLDKLKQQTAAKQAAGVAGQQQAQQQMAATQQSNAASSQVDNALVAQVKAIKDKQAAGQLVSGSELRKVKDAAAKGIKEAEEKKKQLKKKKIVAEFKSKFLGMTI